MLTKCINIFVCERHDSEARITVILINRIHIQTKPRLTGAALVIPPIRWRDVATSVQTSNLMTSFSTFGARIPYALDTLSSDEVTRRT